MRAIEAADEADATTRRARQQGEPAQRARRQMEASLRRRALAAVKRGGRAGDDLQHICAALGMDRARLREWQRAHDERVATKTGPKALGRIAHVLDAHTAKAMRHHMAVFGPGIGARELRLEFPDASFWHCETQARIFRRQLRSHFQSCTMISCTWMTAGAVWATDVWEPDRPIAGQFRYVLDIRDLASGFILESFPLEDKEEATVAAHIERAYRSHRPPLVIKSDNGGEFTGSLSQDLHQRWGVTHLLSPPYLPSYNGACEAGHGSLRMRAEMLARRDGTPGDWTCDHLEGARDWANDLTSPARRFAPRSSWASRLPITNDQRDQFRAIVDREWHLRWHHLSIAAKQQGRTIAVMSVQATVSRAAISAALRDLGYLSTRSVPLRQQIPYADASDISP